MRLLIQEVAQKLLHSLAAQFTRVAARLLPELALATRRSEVTRGRTVVRAPLAVLHSQRQARSAPEVQLNRVAHARYPGVEPAEIRQGVPLPRGERSSSTRTAAPACFGAIVKVGSATTGLARIGHVLTAYTTVTSPPSIAEEAACLATLALIAKWAPIA